MLTGNYLTVTEAARQFRVGIATIHTWLKSGALIGLKTPGGHWRIPAEEIDSWLPNREIEARS